MASFNAGVRSGLMALPLEALASSATAVAPATRILLLSGASGISAFDSVGTAASVVAFWGEAAVGTAPGVAEVSVRSVAGGVGTDALATVCKGLEERKAPAINATTPKIAAA